MRPTLAEILTPLDVPREKAVAALRGHEAPLPWYVRALSGSLGWAAAGSFLAAVRYMSSEPVRFAVGLGAVVAALLLRRRFTRGFFGHLALALALFGETLAVESRNALDLSAEGDRLFSIGVEVVLFAFYRDALMRFMSTVAACAFAFDLFHVVWPQAVVDVPLLVMMIAALVAFHRRALPFAYGAAFSAFCLMLSTVQHWFPEPVSPNLRWYVAAVLALELAVVLREGRVWALAFCAALAAVTFGSPGVMVALAFLVAGFHARDLRLVGAAAVFLLLFGADFYYELELSLLEKSGILAATGLLFLFAWRLLAQKKHEVPPTPIERFALPMSVVTALLLVNVLIVQKERVLRTGDTVLLELRPRDPRSMMEGDYMALRYSIANHTPPRRSGRMVVRLDGRHVASFVRYDDRTPLQPGEHLLRYKERDNGLSLGAESFYFQEGHADRYGHAAYGELKVTPSGDSVLVGLRDSQLELLGGPEPFSFRAAGR
jgi:uncharacterized membrane-anchored protein